MRACAYSKKKVARKMIFFYSVRFVPFLSFMRYLIFMTIFAQFYAQKFQIREISLCKGKYFLKIWNYDITTFTIHCFCSYHPYISVCYCSQVSHDSWWSRSPPLNLFQYDLTTPAVFISVKLLSDYNEESEASPYISSYCSTRS